MYRKAKPLRPEEAFEDDSQDAQLSQAAFVLATGLIVAGYGDQLESEPDFLVPEATAVVSKGTPSVDEALQALDIARASHVSHASPDLIKDRGVDLASKTIVDADPVAGVALIEASTHSTSPVVRTSAAAAAVSATGPREDLVGILESGVDDDDDLVRDVSATALAHVDLGNQKLRALVGEDPDLGSQQGG